MNFKDLHINVKSRIIISFFQRLVGQMIVPFMAIYLANSFGAGTAGTIMIVIVIASIIAIFLGGHVSDSKGRKRIILISEFMNGLLLLLMALANSKIVESPLLTAIFFLFYNVTSNFCQPAIDAMIIDVSTPSTRNYIYQINYWTINVSFAIGTMIGTLLFYDYFSSILFWGGLVTFVIFILYKILLIESKPQLASKKNPFAGYKNVFRDSKFLLFLLASSLLLSIEYQLTYFISVRLTEQFPFQMPFSIMNWKIGISGIDMYGILRMINTFCVVFLIILMKNILKRFSVKNRLFYGILVFTIGYMVLMVSNDFWSLFLAMFLATLGEINYVPVQQSMIAEVIDENNRSKYLAVYGLNQRVGMIIASITLILGDYFNSYILSILVGTLGLVSGSLYFFLNRENSFISKLNS